MMQIITLLLVFSEARALQQALQNVINTASYLSKDTGISLGVATPGTTVALAAGLKNRREQIALQPEDRLGLGSGTKMFTAAAVLRFVHAGRLQLDDVALPYIDPLFRKSTNRSLSQIFGANVRNITVRHLLHMTSGIRDLDTTAGRVRQLLHPSKEMDLQEMADAWVEDAGTKYMSAGSEQNFSCFPGRCGAYSSTNYVMLGIMSAQLSGGKHWLEFDQSAFLPLKLRQRMPRTVFPLKGLCSEFTDVHGYMDLPPAIRTPLRHSNSLIDNQNLACNAGFTMANALTTGKEAAIFLKALLGPKSEILPPKLIAEMTKFRWLETGLGNKVSSGQFYGMGLRDMSLQMSLNPMNALWNPEIFTSGLLLGHDGQSVGWHSFTAYAPQYDFAYSFLMNTDAAAVLFNFIARKTYDISSAVSTPVAAPLRGTYENKQEFLNQATSGKITFSTL